MRTLPFAALLRATLLTACASASLTSCTSANSNPSSSGGASASEGGTDASGGNHSSGGARNSGGNATGGNAAGGMGGGSPSSGGNASNSTGGMASGGTVGMGGVTGGGGAPSSAGGPPVSEFKSANLTNFESYPDPNSEECIKYNGCMWAGQFAGVDGVQPESWVMAHNIVAVHEKDFAKYKLKTLRLRQGTKQIDVTVYDECADSDCDGCCTVNSAQTGFLIDIEKYTMQRFGSGDGVVQWACLDCP